MSNLETDYHYHKLVSEIEIKIKALKQIIKQNWNESLCLISNFLMASRVHTG